MRYDFPVRLCTPIALKPVALPRSWPHGVLNRHDGCPDCAAPLFVVWKGAKGKCGLCGGKLQLIPTGINRAHNVEKIPSGNRLSRSNTPAQPARPRPHS